MQRSVERLLYLLVFVFSAFFGAVVLQRVFSCILFFQFAKECDSSRSFSTRSTKSSLSRAVATLGKLTWLAFEKPEKILQNITWLKEFKQVNCHQHSDSNYTLSRGFFR